jgi:hypothetical protein
MLLLANAGVVAATHEVAPETWRRFAAYMLGAFRAEHAHQLPDAPRNDQIIRSLANLKI